MTTNTSFSFSRRDVLRLGSGLLVSAASFPAAPARAEAAGQRLTPELARAALTGKDNPRTDVWAYNSRIPGPTIRLRQGEPARIVVENGLDEDTTVHWHGIRLPNAMDGVPYLTQPPIRPGESFTYVFTPPDAGTFWYHPHANNLVQLGRGLAGALIVEEKEPLPFDRDLLWVLKDWRLGTDGQIASGFGNPMEAAMSGRVGNTVTLNGRRPADQHVRAGERIRLRLLNTSLARIMALRFEGHRPVVVAVDGQPCDPHEPKSNRLLLAPAMRIDVVLDMAGDPGKAYRVIDDFYDRLEYELTRLVYSDETPLRANPPDTPFALPRNPLPEPELNSAVVHDIEIQGGMRGSGMMRGMGGMMGGMGAMMDTGGMMSMGQAVWAINGQSMTGDGASDMPPLVTLRRSRTQLLRLHNATAWWHPMHLHGFSFRLLAGNGLPVPHTQWADTVLLAPDDRVEAAFVADNPGDWMFHCHITDHQVSGLMAVLRVSEQEGPT